MKRMMAYFAALCMGLTASASLAADVYDWRAKTEWICAQSFQITERQILGYMAGGRPENLVVEKMKDAVPIIQALGEIDEGAARVVVKSLVHSFFADSELRLPIYTIKSVQKARIKCSSDLVSYDPDGRKAEAYQKVKAEEQKRKNEQARIKAKESEKKRQEEEKAYLEKQRKQEEEANARAAEEARILREQENARLERERQLKAEEDARQQRELKKNRAEVAERQKQHDAAIKDMLKNTRTDEENSGLKGFIKNLW